MIHHVHYNYCILLAVVSRRESISNHTFSAAHLQCKLIKKRILYNKAHSCHETLSKTHQGERDYARKIVWLSTHQRDEFSPAARSNCSDDAKTGATRDKNGIVLKFMARPIALAYGYVLPMIKYKLSVFEKQTRKAHSSRETLPTASKAHSSRETLPTASKAHSSRETLPTASKAHSSRETLPTASKAHSSRETLPTASKAHSSRETLPTASKAHSSRETLPTASKAHSSRETLPTASKAHSSRETLPTASKAHSCRETLPSVRFDARQMSNVEPILY